MFHDRYVTPAYRRQARTMKIPPRPFRKGGLGGFENYFLGKLFTSRRERRGYKREGMAASHPCSRGDGERKVRAPQGRVVRNSDCFREAGTVPFHGDKESATENIPSRLWRDKGEKAR